MLKTLPEPVILDLQDVKAAGGSGWMKGGCKFFVVAPSGKFTWRPDGDRLLRKISSTTAQWALTKNGMTYLQIAALTPPAELGAGQIICYSNASTQDGMNVFIPADTELTLSVSNSGNQYISLYWDYPASLQELG